MSPGLAFLSKKSFHVANQNNQERVWIAEQKQKLERARTEELTKQILQEREQEELDRIAGKKQGDRGIQWMYEEGGGAALREERDQARAEEFLCGKTFDPAADRLVKEDVKKEDAVGVDAVLRGSAVTSQDTVLPVHHHNDDAAGDRGASGLETSAFDRNEEFRLRFEDPMYAVTKRRDEQREELEKKRALFQRVMGTNSYQAVPITTTTATATNNNTTATDGPDEARRRHKNSRNKKKKKRRRRDDREYDHRRKRRTSRSRSRSSDDATDHSDDRSSRRRHRRHGSDHRRSSRNEYRSNSRERRGRRRRDRHGDDDDSSSSSTNSRQRRHHARRRDGKTSDREDRHHHHHPKHRHNHHDHDDTATNTKEKQRQDDDTATTTAPDRRPSGFGLQSATTAGNNDHQSLGPDPAFLLRKKQQEQEARQRHKRRRHDRPHVSAEERARAVRDMQTHASERDEALRAAIASGRAATTTTTEQRQQREASFLRDLTQRAHGVENDVSLATRVARNRHTNQRSSNDSFL